MKKIMLLLLLVLVVGIMALPVNAEAAHPHSADHCICGGSAVGNHDHVCENVTWKPVADGIKSFAYLESGNYYLTGDITVTERKTFTKKLTICLNGYNIYTTADTVFSYIDPGAELNICDCSGQYADGLWTWDGTVYANQEEGKSRNYGAIMNTQANSTVRIFGGNFVGCKGTSTKNGGVFNVSNDDFESVGATSNTDSILTTSFTFYNGHAIGGTATSSGGVLNVWHNPTVRLYGGYFEGGTCTATGGGGSLGITSTTKAVIDGTIVTGATPANVLVMEGNICKARYGSLKEALGKVKSGQYLLLTGDVDESETIPAGVLVDLGGNTLRGVTVAEGAMFMDSATDNYTGILAGRLIPASGVPSSDVKTTAAQTGAIRRYMTVHDETGYSFHRFYMAITKASVNPTNIGVGYKAQFVGSEYVEQYLSSTTAFGYALWLQEDNKIIRGMTADKFGGNRELTLRINKFLSTGKSAAENAQRAETPVYASVYVRLNDGTLIESDPVCYTFRDILEAANANYSAYSTLQKNGLINLSNKFSASMIGYDIDNFHHTTGSVWQQKTGAEFNALLKKSTELPTGHYVLTEDVNIGDYTIRVKAGRTVTICLNGHTLHSNARLFRVYGTLNLCDCHAEGQEGFYTSADSYDTDDTDIGEFAPIMYCYANSVTNIYGGNLKADNPISFAGLIAVSHDLTDKTLPSAVLNMYGGTMYGNTVDGGSANNKSGSGGAICLWNGGNMNMYGGTIIGGTAHQGAAIYVGSTDSTLNVFGGTIRDGKAVKRTNAEGKTTAARGGNIYNYGITNIHGGTISGGIAAEGQGGNIYTSGPINITGGIITGGKATAYTDQDGKKLYNSAEGGGVYVYYDYVYVTGDPVISGNSNGNLYLDPVSGVTFEKLTGNAEIGMYSEVSGAVSADTTTMNYVTSDKAGYSFYNVNNRVMFGKSKPASFKENITTFSVGYSITNITPTESGLIMSKWGNPNGKLTDGSVGWELMATVIAITDKENTTVLMITVDLQSIADSYVNYFTRLISEATGVPDDHIYITTTHTHNCPSVNVNSQENARYVALLSNALISGSINALADRGAATMKTGQFETQGLNYTRNYYYYLNNDKTTEPIYFGDQFGQAPQNKETIYRVREGDHTMHMIEFTRTGKKPILMVNWRAHPHRSGGMWNYSSDADVIGATREYFQNNTNYLFAYYQGAAGNMNTTSRLSGETFGNKNNGVENYIRVFGNEMGRQITTNGIPKLKSAATGLIQTDSYIYEAPVNHDDEIYYEAAQRLWDYHEANPDKMDSYAEQIAEANSLNPDGTRKYEGVYTVYHAQQIIARHNLGETKNVSLNTFSIGKSVGFCTSAGEIWDRASEEIELQRSSFPETWFIGYCDGGVGYIPYGVVDNYESYEYYSCVFKQDEVILQIMDYLEGFLDKQWQSAK